MANQVTIRDDSYARADTSGYKQLAKDLRAQKSPLARDLRLGLREAADRVASTARDIAGEVSESVPPSIKVRVSGVTVAVVAGGLGVPLAGLLELGNKTSRSDGMFRAPNFPPNHSRGPRAFVYGGHLQPMHPYLVRAAHDNESEFEEEALRVLDRVELRLAAGSDG